MANTYLSNLSLKVRSKSVAWEVSARLAVLSAATGELTDGTARATNARTY